MRSSHVDLDRLKLKYVTWYCDKEPHGFVAFMSNCAAVTRSLGFDMEVELYLDVKLSRTTYHVMLVSSVISADPDYAPPEPGSQGEEVTSGNTTQPEYHATRSESQQIDTTHRTMRSMASLKGAPSQSSTILPSAGSFCDLSHGARNLDRMLFSVFRTLVIGCKSVLLDCIQDQSYIQGTCLLYKPCDISRNDRIHNAFDGMDSFIFKASAQAWAITSITAIKELFDSRDSLLHYCLTRVMHSLDGKHKIVQYKIAEDLNAVSAVDDVNIYDPIQTHASMIASVGEPTPKPALAIQNDNCHNCGELGHHSHQCTKDASNSKGKGRGKREHLKGLKCDFCGIKNSHIEADCREK